MSKSIVDIPPGKALRLGLRLPIWLYRLHLGWLRQCRLARTNSELLEKTN